MKSFIFKYKYQLFLFFIVLILFLVNYKPGTYLSGWDNLQTELNPGLAVKRAFFSVWEEYQSFGLTAGMAHAADLPRVVFLWIVSFVVPQNMIRYFYHFLMLLLGGLGMFELLGGGIVAFLGALFYMLNLGTVQIFYLSYESFSTFFAFLPWGIWSFIKTISNIKDQKSKRNIFLFVLINLLGTPSFYTQQLFIVYLLILGCISIGFLFSHPKGVQARKIFFSFLLIFIINSFWLLPQFYFLKSNGGWVTQSKTNQIATEDTLYQNLEKGTLNNFFRLEGFYFDLRGIRNTSLFAPWKDHFNGYYGMLPYLFGGLGILGLLGSFRKRNNLGFLLILLFTSLALLSATPPFSWINIWLRQNSSINQVFRSPFTKFIIPYSLVYSYFVAKGLSSIRTVLKKDSPLFVLVFVLIIFYSLPSLKGYFISPEMKVKIPEDYQSIINYFKTEDKSKRIVLSPDYTFWGWFFNKWGYNGSGFIWYGIEQPIVSRTFDVWSKASESYFWEAKTAFEAENVEKILNVFDKYQVDYLILDKSLIPVVSSYKALQYDRINELLMKSSKITLIFTSENISLYKIDHDYSIKNFISLASNLININPKISITNDDQAFSENGFYTDGQNSETDIFYPFLSLTSQTNLKEKNWQITEDNNYFYLSAPLTINVDNFDLYLPDIYQELILVSGQPVNFSLKLESIIKDKKITIKIEKIALKNFNTQIDQKINFGFSDLNLSQNIGYLIKTQSVNNQGLHLFFYIIDETKKQSYLEDRLNNQINYFILPPRYDYGLGYTFGFQNKSFKNLTAINNLNELSLYLFPYKALKETKFVKKGFNKSSVSFSSNYEVKKINYFTYKVTPLRPSGFEGQAMKQFNNLILYQSYDPGWIAIQNGKILSHVLINNWANGWRLRPEQIETSATQGANQQITIVFWPQYLEFFGLGLLVLVIIYLFIKERYGKNA